MGGGGSGDEAKILKWLDRIESHAHAAKWATIWAAGLLALILARLLMMR